MLYEVDPPPLPEPGIRFGLKQLLLLPALVALVFAAATWVGFPMAICLGFLLISLALLIRRTTWKVGAAGLAFTVATMLFVHLINVAIIDARKVACSNNLRQLAIGAMAYESYCGRLPPAFTTDSAGRRLHSWRTIIGPFLESNPPLWGGIKSDQPWDSPHNHSLAVHYPLYCCPDSDATPGTTNYVCVAGPDTAWPGNQSVRFAEITDGLPYTILLAETTPVTIHWMEPRDLELGKFPLEINPPGGGGIASRHPPPSRFPRRAPAGANVLFADGHVRFLLNDLPTEILAALLTRSGHEPLPEGFDENTNSR